MFSSSMHKHSEHHSEYDKRYLLKNFDASKLSIVPFSTTLEIGDETFFVPAGEESLPNDAVMQYYKYVLENIKKEKYDNFYKILGLQNWGYTYIPGRTLQSMYSFLEEYITSSMEEYNVIYLKLLRKKELSDGGEVTIIRTHIVGRFGLENRYDYGVSPYYIFLLKGREYYVPATNVASVLSSIDARDDSTIVENLLKTEEGEYKPQSRIRHSSPRSYRRNHR